MTVPWTVACLCILFFLSVLSSLLKASIWIGMITKVLYLCEILHVFSEALEFTECLLRVSHCSEHFTSVTLIIAALCPSYSQGNWGSERLSNWSKIIVLGRARIHRARIQAQAVSFGTTNLHICIMGVNVYDANTGAGLALSTGNHLWRWSRGDWGWRWLVATAMERYISQGTPEGSNNASQQIRSLSWSSPRYSWSYFLEPWWPLQ